MVVGNRVTTIIMLPRGIHALVYCVLTVSRQWGKGNVLVGIRIRMERRSGRITSGSLKYNDRVLLL